MAEIPPSFKTITSAIRRAEEADKSSDRDSAVLAYACRMSAVTKATKITTNAREETVFILSQLDALERAKKAFSIVESDCVQVVRAYATTIFDKADEVDRQGLADKATAKLFYAAVTYYDVLEFYGTLDTETNEKRKYSKWKAAEILNACNSGVKPTPGGYGEMASFSSSTASAPPALTVPTFTPPTQPASAPTAPLSPTPPSYTQPSFFTQPASYTQPAPTQPMGFGPTCAPTAPQSFFAPTAPAHSHSTPGASRAPPLNNADPRVKDAIEICSFAVSALKHNEIQLARERLQEALRRLG